MIQVPTDCKVTVKGKVALMTADSSIRMRDPVGSCDNAPLPRQKKRKKKSNPDGKLLKSVL